MDERDSLDRIIADAMKKKQNLQGLQDIPEETAATAEEQVIYEKPGASHHRAGSGTQKNRGGKKPKKRWTKKKIAITATLSVLCVLILFGGAVLLYLWSKINLINTVPTDHSDYVVDSIEPEEEDLNNTKPNSDQSDIDKAEQAILDNYKDNEQELVFSDDVYNILLIGNDARDNSSRGRSDSMILVSINKSTKEIVLTSFMRDIYLAIPDKGSNRINAAYAYGGASLLVDTIQNNFGIRIDRYAQINFYNFIDIIDAVGGVEIAVSDAEVEVMNGYIHELNNLRGDDYDDDILSDGGTYNLNGKQALGYCRVRYVGNADFQRTQRQRDVMLKVIEKAKGMSVTELNNFLNMILPEITTNMSEGEIFSLALKSVTYFGYDMEQLRIPTDDAFSYLTIDGMSVLGVDFDSSRKSLLQTIYHQ